MLRFLLAGTATVGGLILLFMTSFADPSALRAWRAAIPALPAFQAQPEPSAPRPADQPQQPDATDTTLQQQRATLQEQVRRLEAQLSDTMREMSDLQAQAAQAKRDLDEAERRRVATQAEQAAEAAKSPEAKAQAEAQPATDSHQLDQAGAAPPRNAEVRPPQPVAVPQPAIALAPAGRASRPSPWRPAMRAEAGQRRGALRAVTAPVPDRPDVPPQGALVVGEPSAADTDATRSVIERLRNQPEPPPAPEPAVATAAERPAQPAFAEARRVAPRDRLAKARGAIAAGRIAEAQQLLEEAQLQLVFRPLTPAGGDPSTASRSAGQVAGALTMLGSGYPGRAVQFIDQALGESGGAPVAAPTPYNAQDWSGARTAAGRPYR